MDIVETAVSIITVFITNIFLIGGFASLAVLVWIIASELDERTK